jgi:hypothetical protein
MNRNLRKVSTGVMLLGLLLVAPSAYAVNAGGKAALKDGRMCIQQEAGVGGGWLFECENMGKNLSIPEIYRRGWRVVSSMVNHDYKSEYVTLIIEEQ